MSKLTIWKDKKAKSGNALVLADKARLPHKRSFEQMLAAVHEASGHIEYRVLPLRCGRHDMPYAAIFKREAGDELYRLDRMETKAPEEAASGKSKGLLARHMSGKATRKTAFDFSEFDRRGLSCPWCGDDGGTIHCEDCGDTYCRAGVSTGANGRNHYRCVPRCGSSGPTVKTDKVNAHQARPKSRKERLAHEARPSLLPLEASKKTLKAMGTDRHKFLPGK